MTLYNYGSPRTGNAAFVTWAEGILDSASVRMRRQLDIVPSIPPRSIGYRHIRTEVWDKHNSTESDSYEVCDGLDEGASLLAHMSRRMLLHTQQRSMSIHLHSHMHQVCNGSGEDPACGDSEEHPPFPLYLLHLKPSEHTRYMGYQGGGCVGGGNDESVEG